MNAGSPAMTLRNIHASMAVVGDRGIVITGEPGSGKSSLAMVLAERAKARGIFARLVGDDQVLVTHRNGLLLCMAPAAIAGLVEVRGLGPSPVPHLPAAVADLVVQLVEPGAAPRMASDGPTEIAGIRLPLLVLAARDASGAARAVEAWLARAT